MEKLIQEIGKKLKFIKKELKSTGFSQSYL